MDVKDIYIDYKSHLNKTVTVEGWIRKHRKQKECGFIEFNDGTYFNPIQVVYDSELEDFNMITTYKLGSAIKVTGTVIASPAAGQEFEIKAKEVILLGDSKEDYPLQNKVHTKEYLREIGHLRPRANLFQAVFRLRSVTAFAIHKYFNERGFLYVHTPIITASDAEGAGEMFKVTTLDMNNVPKEEGKVNYKGDFFSKETALTVSGQLEAEIFAMAFKKVYTFGPTFRAENSHTKTHASEFWMIEPEIAFADLNDVMDVEEDMLKYIIKYVLENAKVEMEFFDQYVEKGIIEKLSSILNKKAVRVTHEDAIDILLKADVKFENKPAFGEDIATEHEKYLTEVYFKSPVFITNWPKDIKAFYMRLNDDGKTVAAVDLLVPGAGELMGGSQREERLDYLEKRMGEMNIDSDQLYWYLDLRRYGGCIHGGFGLGFERLLIYLSGVENIRDVIPFPRTPNTCDF